MNSNEIRELSRIIWNAIGLRNLSVHVTFWVVVVDCRLLVVGCCRLKLLSIGLCEQKPLHRWRGVGASLFLAYVCQ